MEKFPNAQVEEDHDGQLIIYTDWFVKPGGLYKLGFEDEIEDDTA